MGVTVGMANVRILPDTRGFAKKLEAELKRLNDVRAEVGVDFDAEGLTQKAKAAADAASKSAQVKPDVDVDSQEIVQKARLGAMLASKSAEVKVRTKLEVDNLRRQARAAALMASATSHVVIRGKFDARGIVRDARDAARDAGKRAIHFAAEIDPSVLVAKARAARMVAQRAMGPLKVGMEISGSAALKLAMQAAAMQMNMFGASTLKTALTALPALIGKAGLAAVAVGGLAGPLALIAGHALAAAGSMAALGAAMAPTAIVAAGLAVGTLVAAFKGMGDALKAESLEDLNKAIEGMPPSMQAATTSIWEMKNQFADLGSEISEGFWANLSNIGDLASLIEPIRWALIGVSNDMGNAAAGLVAFVSQGVGLEAVSTLLDHAQTAGSNLAYAFADVLRGVIAVGAAVGPVLGDMTAKMSEAATAWSDRMVAGFQDGSLQQFFSDAVLKVQQFWGVLQQVGSIVGAVFSAMSAAGAPFLGTIGQIITATEQWVNSAQGMEALTSFFTGMTGAVSVLLPVIGQLAAIIGTTVAPAIANFVTAIGPGLSAAVDGLAGGLAAIAPALGPLGAAFGQILAAASPLLPVLGQLIGALGTALTPVISALAPIISIIAQAFGALAPVVSTIAGILGSVLAAALQALTPIVDVLGQAVAMIAPYLQQLAMIIGAALLQAIEMITPYIPMLAQAFMTILQAVMPLLPIIINLAQVLLSALMPVIAALLPIIVQVIQIAANIIAALAPIVTIVLQVAAAFLALLGTILGFAASVLGAILNMVLGVINAFVSLVSTVVAAVAGFVSTIIGFFANMSSDVQSTASRMWARFVDAVSQGVANTINHVSQLPGRVLSALGDLSSLLNNSGRALIQGFINGIKSKMGAVADAARSAVKAARDFFPFSPAKKGPFSGRGYTTFSGKALATDFAGGIKSATPLAARATEGLMSAASGNLRGYRAGVDLASASGGAAGGAGVDTSVHIGQLVAADMSAPLEQVKTMQLRAQIKAGIA